MDNENFIEQYLKYYSGTEVPTIYDRWCCISGIGALLERNCYIIHSGNKIYPNQYIMLVGESGARKDTAINRIKKLLEKVEYKTIAAEKTSKEKLLLDMEIGLENMDSVEYELDVTNNKTPMISNGKTTNPTLHALFPQYELAEDPVQCYIIAGEWNAFFGLGNIDFITLLTQLWDYDSVYRGRIKTGKSVRVPYPTINILGGNTPVNIAQGFPLESIGQGIFSRLLMIYSEPTGVKITWPEPKDSQQYAELIKNFSEIKKLGQGEFKFEPSARDALDVIYQTWEEIDDSRFKSYSSRRLTHLFKLCQICAIGFYTTTITLDAVIYANSILTYAEFLMPKALGEFGKAKHSDVTVKILNIIDNATKPLEIMRDIWPIVMKDLDSKKQLQEIISGLYLAGKIDFITTKIIPKKITPKFDKQFCDVNMLKEYQEYQLKKEL